MTRVDVPRELAHTKAWLLKPFNSGGGQGVRVWTSDAHVTAGLYAQERIGGIPASIVFVAAAGKSVPLGISRQLIGDAAFGASGYRYCGNVLASADDDVITEPVVSSLLALARDVTEQFGLVGLNVNPRWCSSMELVERHYGVSLFGAHAAACVDEVLPAFDLSRARRTLSVLGKAIVFAPYDLVARDTRSWLSDDTVRDVPHPGERLSTGQPICTVFAEAADHAQCLAHLKTRAQAIVSRCASE
jgi:predicted ATP-grasp superfamily ATP-dependent carboligase